VTTNRVPPLLLNPSYARPGGPANASALVH
jgi:hypothetical protein